MLVLELIEQYVNRTILLWRADKSIPFYDVEVTCHLIYLLGESLPVEKGHTHFTVSIRMVFDNIFQQRFYI